MKIINSKSTDKLMVVTAMLIELKGKLDTADVDWKEMKTSNGTLILPIINLRFKDGSEEKKTVR